MWVYVLLARYLLLDGYLLSKSIFLFISLKPQLHVAVYCFCYLMGSCIAGSDTGLQMVNIKILGDEG